MSRLLAILVGLVLLGACEKRAAPPSTPAPPSPVRIVSISPAVGIMLTDLHYDHLCVGRDGHDLALHPSIPVVGNQNVIDYEAVIAARPTHVFTQWGSRDLPARLVELAGANGWRLIDSRLLTLEDVRQTVAQLDRELCEATGAVAPSEACRGVMERMDAAWVRSAGKDYSKLGKVLLLAQTSPPAAFGPGSCHYQMLEKLGVTPAIGSGAAYITLDSEDLLHMAPDAIILISPRKPESPPPAPEDARRLRDAKFAAIGALDIPAAKGGRMGLIDDPRGFIPSTSLIRLAEEVREVLDGWQTE